MATPSNTVLSSQGDVNYGYGLPQQRDLDPWTIASMMSQGNFSLPAANQYSFGNNLYTAMTGESGYGGGSGQQTTGGGGLDLLSLAQKGKQAYDLGKNLYSGGQKLYNLIFNPNLYEGLTPQTMAEISGISPEMANIYEGLSPATLAELSGVLSPLTSGVEAIGTGAGISSGIEGGIAAGTMAAETGSAAAGGAAAAAAPLAAYLGPIGAFIGGGIKLGTQLYSDQQERRATTQANNTIAEALADSPQMRDRLFAGLSGLTPQLSETRAYDPNEQDIFSGVPNRAVTSALADMFKGDTTQMQAYDPSGRLAKYWDAFQTYQNAANKRTLDAMSYVPGLQEALIG